ncbi:MAG: glycosyl transferase, family 2 [uncultured Rubrobacteraceae bacterium]|uniref:Glycosyl transferase, family 2 n=1 Tax=uncultured Rubrobacteraceae bacterium TaxID=349277 RepID=A0A6J4QQZ1_9ACTN|nr:MAG: glycosyl transferase, family 2 [uncultured Rubrobacteraceae bacterium]
MSSPALPRVTVVIPNWNGERFLDLCLTSLRCQSFKDFETVLVDNGSTDTSVKFTKRNFPEVRVVSLDDNRGFSVAVNVGIRASEAEYVALLNNDTEVDPGWLEALTRAGESYLEAGLFASKLVDFHDRRVLDGAGDALRRSGLPYRIGHQELDRGQFDEPALVFSACAAAALYRRSLFEEIGPFDEDFFAYCEDGDVSFRAQLAGYQCVYVPEAVVYHMGSASTGGKRSPTATRLGTQNSVNLLIKNLPVALVWRSLPSLVGGQLARILATSFSGSGLRAHLGGLAGAWHLLPRMLEKRKGIQSRRRVSDDYVSQLLQYSSRQAKESRRRRVRDRIRLRLKR